MSSFLLSFFPSFLPVLYPVAFLLSLVRTRVPLILKRSIPLDYPFSSLLIFLFFSYISLLISFFIFFHITMNPTSLPFKTSEDELNACISGLLSQQSSASASASASFAPFAPAAYNGFDHLTSAETSFWGDLPPGLTWDDYLLITEGLLLEGTPSFDMPVGISPGVSNINTSGGPSTFNVAGGADITTSRAPSMFTFGAGSAGINMPVGYPMPNLVAGNTAISMPGALPTFGFTTGSTNINMPGGPQKFDLSPESTGIDVPVGLQTTIEHQSYLGYGNGGFPNGTNVGGSMVTGGWVGTSQQVRQPINGVHAPLALPNTHLKTSSSKTRSTKGPNTPPAPPTTPQPRRCGQTPATMPNSNTSSETLSPPERSQSSSPSARPPPKRRKDWRKGPKATFRFVQDERSMPPNFRANPDNHGRFQYTATGRRKYLNAPGAAQERRRRREGNQVADQQGACQQGNGGK